MPKSSLKTLLIAFLVAAISLISSTGPVSAARVTKTIELPTSTSRYCDDMGPEGGKLGDSGVQYQAFNPREQWEISSAEGASYSCITLTNNICPQGLLESINISGNYSIKDAADGAAFEGDDAIMAGLMVDGETLHLEDPELAFTLLAGNFGTPPPTSPDYFTETLPIERTASVVAIALIHTYGNPETNNILSDLRVDLNFSEGSNCDREGVYSNSITPATPKAGSGGLYIAAWIAVGCTILSFAPWLTYQRYKRSRRLILG